MANAEVDVAVLGAGPAGAVAACLLARRGRRVLLMDPQGAGSAGNKPGEALAGAADRLLKSCGMPCPSRSGAHSRIGGNISVWGGTEPIFRDFVTEPDGPSWRLDRAVFETELIAAAAAAGARLYPQAVRKTARHGADWGLQLRNGEVVTAAWVIDATGRAAAVARRLGAQRYRDEPLVAVVARAVPDPGIALERTLVESRPEGWWYAALLPDRAPVFMLHTQPSMAGHLLANPDLWRMALASTPHISRWFCQPSFNAPPKGFEACGAWLEPVYGDGWVACGDAALSFDPCSGQGIFSALYGGMAVSDAVDAALAGDAGPLDAYARQLATVREVYRQRLRSHYAAEQRWPDAPFWAERLACPQ